jgi:hypothetical protein
VVLKGGKRLPADVVILGLGVRPDTALARAAGLTLNARGAIVVRGGRFSPADCTGENWPTETTGGASERDSERGQTAGR